MEDNSQCAYTGIRVDGCQTFGQKIWFWLRLKWRDDTETIQQIFGPCSDGFKRLAVLFLKGSKSAKVVLD